MHSSIVRAFYPVCLLGLSLLIACTPFQTRDDFNSARKEAQKGGAACRQVTDSILQNLTRIPGNLRGEALDVVIACPGDIGDRAVLTISQRAEFQDPESKKKIINRLMQSESKEATDYVLKEIAANPALIDDAMVKWLLERDPPGAADLLLAQVQAKPEILNDGIATYFGKKKLTAAVPLLIASIKANRSPEASLRALSQIGGTEANQTIIDVAKTDNAARVEALRLLPQIKDESKKTEIMKLLTETWDKGSGPVRSTSLESLAKMRGLEPEGLERDLLFSMSDVQGDLAVNTLSDKKRESTNVPATSRDLKPSTPRVDVKKDSKPDVKVDAKTEAKKDARPVDKPTDKKETKPATAEREPLPVDERASIAYKQRISNIFTDTFGDGGSAILRRIQDSLYTYSESNTPSAEFIIRAYKKRYGGNDAAVRKMLARGLKQPDCLNAVLTNVRAEYPSKEMQIYALSKLFALKRWQSQVLLEVSQELQL
ncbi:MAG: hypothetical protein K8S54_14445 [Spirochaetia bacterium]|nr:hypothetical protein [Spirochaetia bacterium]